MKTENQAYTIHFGDREIPFSLQRNGRKRQKIVVPPELAVTRPQFKFTLQAKANRLNRS